jgi:thioredoxin 1
LLYKHLNNSSTYLTIHESALNELLSQKEDRPFLVAFTADWLGEGTIMDTIVEGLAEVHQGQMSFYRVDVEQSKNAARQLGIRRLPAILLFKQGELFEHISGMVPSRTLQERLAKLLS